MLQKYLKIVGVVALYWSISITLVFVNKSLLKGDELKLDAPLFVTFYQCVCTVILCKSKLNFFYYYHILNLIFKSVIGWLKNTLPK